MEKISKALVVKENIAIYPRATFEEIANMLDEADDLDESIMEYIDAFFSNSYDNIQIDVQNRVLIPLDMRNTYLKDASSVVFKGVGKYIKVVDKDLDDKVTDKFKENRKENYEKFVRAMKKQGI